MRYNKSDLGVSCGYVITDENKKLKMSLSTPQRHKGRAEVQLYSFLTSVLDGVKWSTSRSGAFNPWIHWRGGWVGPRTGLDDFVKNFLPLPGLNAGLSSQYPSHYTDHSNKTTWNNTRTQATQLTVTFYCYSRACYMFRPSYWWLTILQNVIFTSWYYQRFLFTNECTSDCLKYNIKIYNKIAPTVGAIYIVNFNP